MSYAIVYSSKTGNTARLAKALKAALPERKCTHRAPRNSCPSGGLCFAQKRYIYCGGPDKKAENVTLIFVGFWTDKGSCDEVSAAFLEGLRGKRVFLFGTAGFGGSEDYFCQILSRVRVRLDGSNTVVGSYMCQGKMPAAVRKRYEAMEAQVPEEARALIANFDRAVSHPDEADLEGLKRAVAAYI